MSSSISIQNVGLVYTEMTLSYHISVMDGITRQILWK